MNIITEPQKKVRQTKKNTELNSNSLIDPTFYEMSGFYDVINASGVSHGFTNIRMKDLMNWLRNPPNFRKQLIQISKYYYNQNGIVTDCYDLFNKLPILNQSVLWGDMEKKSFSKNKTTVDTFYKSIKVNKIARDTIFTVIQEGTCVWYLRDNKYIQFLENEEIKIEYMVNGKWQVFYDLLYINQYNSVHSVDFYLSKINAAPDEVTLAAFNDYRKLGDKYRYVLLDITKTQVFKLRGARNEPYGVPYAIPAISSIMHRDLLEKTEKTLADRITNQIIVQKVGNMPTADGKIGLPVPKETVALYHTNLKNLLQKKVDNTTTDNSTTAPLTVPSFVDIEELKVNMNTFPKETWERIDKDIYRKLGYSESLNSGGGSGQSFGSSSINVEKIYSIINYLLEDIESAIDEYVSFLKTKDNFAPRIKFGRSTFLDKETPFKQAEALFLKAGGSRKHYVESAGYDFDIWLEQVRYENEVLNLDEILPIHATSFTQNGDNPNGRPNVKNPTNENTTKSKGNSSTKV